MGLYDRNKGVAGTKKRLWISYSITEEQRIRFGLKSRTVREPVPSNSDRAGNALLAHRNREVRADTWQPRAGGTGSKTVEDYVRMWTAKRDRDRVRSAHDEAQRLRDYVVPVLGAKPLADVTRKQVVELISNLLGATSEKTGKRLAPRTIHRVYEDLRTMYNYAVEVDQIVPVSPCTLKVKRGELPPKKDADPRWRASAVYTRDEVEALLSDERIDLPDRVNYALLFLTGSRVGEIVGWLWRDYEPKLQPLGRLLVATSYENQETKTDITREVPVHPVLASILATWKLSGFAEWMGRAPRPDDYIVPKWRTRGGAPVGSCQDSKTVWRHLQRDLLGHGFRPRRTHDTRRTLISLARADGANKDILEWITHGPSRDDMQDLYSSFTWDVFCTELGKLRIALRTDAPVIPLRSVRWSQLP